MTKFDNIKQALDYHATCPICDSIPDIRNENIRYDNYEADILRIITPRGNDEYSESILYIDILTNVLTIDLNNKHPSKPYNGIYHQGITLDCSQCNEFHFILKLTIDINQKIVSNIELNSEAVLIRDEEGAAHRIKNTYYDNKTTYDFNFKPLVVVPMIPINFDNIEETMDRLKNLIIFS